MNEPIMATATYRLLDGTDWPIDYDRLAPCMLCGLPVIAASVGGTSVCPWCDTGHYRDGTEWTIRDLRDEDHRKAEARRRDHCDDWPKFARAMAAVEAMGAVGDST